MCTHPIRSSSEGKLEEEEEACISRPRQTLLHSRARHGGASELIAFVKSMA